MPLMKCGHLTVTEVHVAEMIILRHVQEVAEVVGWSINMSAESTAKGRLTSKCPHWLREETPCYHTCTLKYHVRDLIIKQCHESLGYMVIFRRDILDSEREVGSTACDRNLHELSMAEKGMSRRTVHVSLPKDRLITDKPPFTYVGIDYFRLLKVKQKVDPE